MALFIVVYNEMGLRFRWFKDDAKAVLLAEVVTDPTEEQLQNALDKVEEEHHTIVLYSIQGGYTCETDTASMKIS